MTIQKDISLFFFFDKGKHLGLYRDH